MPAIIIRTMNALCLVNLLRNPKSGQERPSSVLVTTIIVVALSQHLGTRFIGHSDKAIEACVYYG